jgi:thioesterase domain-containing protein/acyl carrier protein
MEVPRTETERLLAGMWENLLAVKAVSIRDNFFELGGDSLLAARLFAEIEKKTGRNIPLATLFHSPTVEALSHSLTDASPDGKWSILVPIRTEGSNAPLFLMHGAEGNVLLYRELALLLGDDQPVYGLQSEGLSGKADFRPSLESMAASYVREIRETQPHGPYFLGGYCLGGAIALEVAQQLKRAGEEVAFLAMFETYNLHESRIRSIFLTNLVINVQSALFHALNAIALRPRERSLFLNEKLKTERSRMLIRKDRSFARLRALFRLSGARSYRHVDVGKANDIAHMEYLPQRYEGRITLFRPKVQFLGYRDPSSGWKDIAAKGVETKIIPFFPRAMLVNPFVKTLAKSLSESMGEHRSTVAHPPAAFVAVAQDAVL